jgi:hypothetical protein
MTSSSVLVVVGARPRRDADAVLGDLDHAHEVRLVLPTNRPTAAQHRFVERAMTLAWGQGFTLTAELVPDVAPILASLDGQALHVLADRRERRRLGLPSPGPT